MPKAPFLLDAFTHVYNTHLHGHALLLETQPINMQHLQFVSGSSFLAITTYMTIAAIIDMTATRPSISAGVLGSMLEPARGHLYTWMCTWNQMSYLPVSR